MEVPELKHFTQVLAYLYSRVATEVKIKLIWVCNVCINRCSSWDIATSSNLDLFGQNLNKCKKMCLTAL